MLSSFYRLQMVSAWSSGTGGAGLLGALLFLVLTSWIGLSIPATLGIVAVRIMLQEDRRGKQGKMLSYKVFANKDYDLDSSRYSYSRS